MQGTSFRYVAFHQMFLVDQSPFQEDCTRCTEDLQACFWGVEPVTKCLPCAVGGYECCVEGSFEPLPAEFWTEAKMATETAESAEARLRQWDKDSHPVKTAKWLGSGGDGYETEYGVGDDLVTVKSHYSTAWFMKRKEYVEPSEGNQHVAMQDVITSTEAEQSLPSGQ